MSIVHRSVVGSPESAAVLPLDEPRWRTAVGVRPIDPRCQSGFPGWGAHGRLGVGGR
jgi:hypothetical protein